ncbi:MAG: hypothetical protein ACYCYA_13320, partial [Actinomycetes bacterium]
RRRSAVTLMVLTLLIVAGGLLAATSAAYATLSSHTAKPTAAPTPKAIATPTPTAASAPPVSVPVLAVPGPPGTPVEPTPPPGIVLVPDPAGDTPVPLPSGGTVTVGGGGCGLFNVSCHVTSAINGWFKGLVKSALNPILKLLGHTVLATPELTGQGRVLDLWGVSAGIANVVVVLFVLAGGALVMGHETLQTRYAAKDIAPRIVVAVIAANASLALVGIAIHLVNGLSLALLGPGVDPSNATSVLTQLVTAPLASGGIFLVLMGLVAAVLGLVLLAVYVIRVALLVLLVAAAPLALICHALPQTEGLARLWWRAVAGLLAVQVAQALVLITALRVFFASDGHATLGLASSGGLVDILIAICLLYVLVRIPAWVSRAVFAGTAHSPGSIGRAVKTVVIYKALRAGFAALA